MLIKTALKQECQSVANVLLCLLVQVCILKMVQHGRDHTHFSHHSCVDRFISALKVHTKNTSINKHTQKHTHAHLYTHNCVQLKWYYFKGKGFQRSNRRYTYRIPVIHVVLLLCYVVWWSLVLASLLKTHIPNHALCSQFTKKKEKKKKVP